MKKICISGPAISGKTYFLNKTDHPYILTYPESARKVNNIYPELIQKNKIEEFRKKICQFQIDIESMMTSSDDNMTHIFDRGVIDNLVFLKLNNDKNFEKELSAIKNHYKNNTLRPYDVIYYFDISPFKEFTPLLIEALQDPLRKSTIDTSNFKEHIIDFRNTFIDIISELKLNDKVRVTTTYPTPKDYTERNNLVYEEIKKIIEEY